MLPGGRKTLHTYAMRDKSFSELQTHKQTHAEIENHIVSIPF